MKMKRLSNPVIPDYTPKSERKVKDESLPLKPCIICTKISEGYGAWKDGHTCSRKCELLQEAKPKDFGEPINKQGDGYASMQ